MKRYLILFMMSLLSAWQVWLCAQTMGGWRTHFAYNSVTQVDQTDNKVYAVSDGALFSIDKLDNNVELYSKITGLNGSVVSAIRYDADNRQLVIAYENGNIDLLTSGGIVNIPDFYNKVMNVNKSVSHIDIHDGKAYLACHFGIIVLNLARREIAETYYIGPDAAEVDVIRTAVVGDDLYALAFTPVGAAEGERTYALFRADVNDPNLVNYERWSTVSLPAVATHQAIASFAGKLFAQSDWRLYTLESGDAWSLFPLEDAVAAGISVSGGKMIVANERANVYAIDENLNVQHYPNVVQYARAGVYDAAQDTYWLAGGEVGVTSYQPSTNARNELKPEGPAVNMAWDITFAGEKMFVVPGGRWSNFFHYPPYVMIYENGGWTNVLATNPMGVPCEDFISVAVDPADASHYFAASYSSGLYEFRGAEQVNYYHHNNSTIESAFPNTPSEYSYLMLDGLTYDDAGNLWFVNTLGQSSVKILMHDGQWEELSYSAFTPKETLGKLLINNQNKNQKWFPYVRNGEVGVFDDNGTITEQGDDRAIVIDEFYDTDGEDVAPDYIYTLAQDHDGVIWLGTNKGPILFSNPERVFEGDLTCSRVKIPRNDGTNQADYLLAGEGIRSIAIDGSNRKWIGTETSGVYLLSADGQETIHHFTTDNSPLQSNNVLAIGINPVSGEVFFGTGAGLVSYQSDAADGASSLENVYAYPNPVRENFEGIITITGLVENTQVKITDLNGNLVCETVSNGSIATWDGKDAFGRKVNTGIYLALCITEDGEDSAIAKIMVIN